MKTSVEIPNSLLDAARKAAAREGTTVNSLIERGLRELLAKRKDGREFRLRKAPIKERDFSRALKR